MINRDLQQNLFKQETNLESSMLKFEMIKLQIVMKSQENK